MIVHDDGSAEAMYDLRVGSLESPAIAIECVGAVDAKVTELWNVGPARGPLSCRLQGDWRVTIGPNARFGKLASGVEGLLQEFEALRLSDFEADWSLRRSHPHLMMMC